MSVRNVSSSELESFFLEAKHSDASREHERAFRTMRRSDGLDSSSAITPIQIEKCRILPLFNHVPAITVSQSTSSTGSCHRSAE
jgi:hypothetical protein